MAQLIPDDGGEPAREIMRATMLRLTTGIAAAQTQPEIFGALVSGMMDKCFGFTGVSVRVADSSASSVEAGVFSLGAEHFEVPFDVDADTKGIITVERARTGFDDLDRELLSVAASHVGVATSRSRFLQSERRRDEERQALLDTLADLSGNLELSRVLHAVLNRAIGLLGVSGGELATYDAGCSELVVVASLNIGMDSTGTRVRLGEGAMGSVAQTHEPLFIPNYREWAGRLSKYEETMVRSVMAVPLLIGDRLVGAIASIHTDPERELGPADLRLLQQFAQ